VTAGGPSGTADLAKQWGSLCERFHEIRLGAFRHGLVEDWRQVARADPDAPGCLAAWLGLDQRIQVLDDQESDYAVRYGETADVTCGDGSGIDDWDNWGDEYACPVGRCDRTARSPLGIPPRCELFRQEMTRLQAQPG